MLLKWQFIFEVHKSLLLWISVSTLRWSWRISRLPQFKSQELMQGWDYFLIVINLIWKCKSTSQKQNWEIGFPRLSTAVFSQLPVCKEIRSLCQNIRQHITSFIEGLLSNKQKVHLMTQTDLQTGTSSLSVCKLSGQDHILSSTSLELSAQL